MKTLFRCLLRTPTPGEWIWISATNCPHSRSTLNSYLGQRTWRPMTRYSKPKLVVTLLPLVFRQRTHLLPSQATGVNHSSIRLIPVQKAMQDIVPTSTANIPLRICPMHQRRKRRRSATVECRRCTRRLPRLSRMYGTTGTYPQTSTPRVLWP